MLTLHLATTIVDAAFERARSLGLAPLCVVVVDAGGHALVLKRDEHAASSRAIIATAKATGCMAIGFGGREIAKRAQSAPAFYQALNVLLPQGILPAPGGVIIRAMTGEALGAVGVSGDSADNDESCAIAGIEAARLVADTGIGH